MPKRKRPPEKRVWARIVNREWRVNLVSGEVLTPVRDLSATEARVLMMGRAVFSLGFLMPVRELRGDDTAIASLLNSTESDVRGPEWNSIALFRGGHGTEAIVIEHHH